MARCVVFVLHRFSLVCSGLVSRDMCRNLFLDFSCQLEQRFSNFSHGGPHNIFVILSGAEGMYSHPHAHPHARTGQIKRPGEPDVALGLYFEDSSQKENRLNVEEAS